MESVPRGHSAADVSKAQHDMRVEETRAAREAMRRFAEDGKFEISNDANLFIDLPHFVDYCDLAKNQYHSKLLSANEIRGKRYWQSIWPINGRRLSPIGQ